MSKDYVLPGYDRMSGRPERRPAVQEFRDAAIKGSQ